MCRFDKVNSEEMCSLSFKISEKQLYYPFNEVTWALFISFFLITFIFISLFNLYILIPILMLIGFSLVVYLYFKEKNQTYELISFCETHIEIGKEQEQVYYSDINKIIIKFYTTKGEHEGSIFFPSTGHRNYIKIFTQGKVIGKNIWSETANDYWRMKSLGKFLTKKKVHIRMIGFLVS